LTRNPIDKQIKKGKFMLQINEQKLHEFVGKMLGDLGGAFSVPTARIGFRLGLFDALHNGGAATASDLAARAGGLAPRYVREWALAQAANGFINFDPADQTFSISPEQAMIFVVKDSPVYLAGAFDLAAAMIEGEAKVEQAFRLGCGVRWGDSAGCLFCATGAFFRPGYVNNIVQTWIPALDGVQNKLTASDQSGRRRLWSRLFHHSHGSGISAKRVCRLRFSRTLDHGRAQPCQEPRRERPRAI
jgi:hypothetical protein